MTHHPAPHRADAAPGILTTPGGPPPRHPTPQADRPSIAISADPPIRRPAGPPTRLSALVLAVVSAVTAVTAVPATAQYPDARVSPRGALRIGFEPTYLTYDHRFGPNGESELLGADLTSDSAGADLLPSVLWTQTAVRNVTANSAYRLSIGSVQTTLDADIRGLAFNFRLGLTDRLTLTASLPFVTARIQADVVVDSTGANAGLNPGSALAGVAGAALAIQTLLSELQSGAALVNDEIMAGSYGCPTSALCDQARDLVTRTFQLAAELGALTGFTATGPLSGGVAPYVPLQSSAEGQAILAAIQSIAAELQSFNATPPSASLPLPMDPAGVETFQSILTADEFGYRATAGIEFIKHRQRLGDAELGFRWGAVQRPSLRAVLLGKVRLPTGKIDEPDHFIDLATGDRQTDLVGGLEAVWLPGTAVAVAVRASYTAQLGDELVRRVTAPDQPIALANDRKVVQRNLGDVFRFAIYPSVRLTEGFTAYGSAAYFRKQQDRFGPEIPCPPSSDPCIPRPLPLNDETAMRTWSFGGGIHYHSVGRTGNTLPIQAGIDYRAAFSGSGGLTPKDVRLNLYLRLYKRVFGGQDSDVSEEN